MSKRISTEWEAYRYSQALGDYEYIPHMRPTSNGEHAFTALLSLWYEDETESPLYAWDEHSEADASKALCVHGLIECVQQAHYWDDEGTIVLVRDWWTKQPLGKLICTQDEIDADLGLEETRA